MIILDLTDIEKIKKKINFNIRLIDTKESIIKRLVYALRKVHPLLPKYVNILDFNFNKKELKVIDLFSLVKERYTDLNSFVIFYKDTKDWEISPVELFKIWIISNLTQVNEINTQFHTLFFKYINDVLKLNSQDFEELLKDIPNFKEEFNNKVNSFLKSLEPEIEFETYFENISEIEYTSFIEDKRKVSIQITNNFSNILDLFDISKLNQFVPYINVIHKNNNDIKEYSKLLKTFNYFEEFINLTIRDSYDNITKSNMKLYLYNIEEIKKDLSVKMYTDIEIIQEQDKFLLELVVYTNELSILDIKNRIQNTFTQEIIFEQEKNIYIGGIFYIPGIYFDKYILADLCISNDLFEKFLKIDESLRAYRKKSSVYVYFTDPRYPNDYLTASISQKFMEKGDLKKVPDNEKFPIGESYIRIKISRAKSLEHVYRFQKILSKLFTEYSKKVDEINDIYQEFIPNFGQIPKVKIKTYKKTLKNLVPSQFISNYTRLCPNPPEIIFKQDKQKYLEKYPNNKTIIFPKTLEEGKQHEYICTDPKYKYPGLKKNNLENKNKFKYLPCCYFKDQSKTNNFKNYYDTVEVEKDDQIKNKRIIITNKILDPDIFGILPEYLNNLLLSIQSNYEFYRKGVTRTKNSFIECIVEAFDQEYSQFSRNDDRIAGFLEKIRTELVNDNDISITRQENYDIDILEIKENILNMENYFDPKKYYRLLEKKYNCNIYLFNENGMIIPDHIQNYLRYYQRYVYSIFIYEHLGSESDNLKYPQCEIIIGMDPNIGNNTQFYKLPYLNHISIEIEKIFVKYNQSYLYKNLSKRIKIPLFEKIISQCIDGYGKTRALNFKYNEHEIMLYSDPLPPISTFEVNFKYIPINIQIAINFFNYLQIPIQHQTVVDEKCIEISGFYENILYTCVVLPTDILDDILIGYTRRIIPNIQSQLTNFNTIYKNAKHLSQLFLYTFSEYFQTLNENAKNAEKIDNEIFKQFVEDRIEQINNYKYSKFNKIILQNQHAYNGIKLIIGGKNSNETLKRLMYLLRLNLERNRDLVIKYYTKNYIYNFYDNITDFIKRKNEIIIPGENALKKWDNDKNLDKKMYLKIQSNNKYPYFVKTSNKNILNRDVYLCNNDLSLNNSMTRHYCWSKLKYNPKNMLNMKDQKVNLEILNYKNMKDIQILKDGTYKVLGYLKNGKVKYTTLLDL